jgi:diguanylate cyclase (GGDEF)-like protein/PAS domain S-box-containing protein
MFMRAKSGPAPDVTIPDDLYVMLVRALFSNMPALILGSVATTLCCITTAVVCDHAVVRGVAALAPVLGLIRVLQVKRFRTAAEPMSVVDARQWENRYTIGAAAYMGLLGIWTLSVYLATDDAFPRVLALTATIGHALGIATRNFSFKFGTIAQLVTGFIPLFATFIVAGGAFVLMIPLVLLPLLLFIWGSAARLRETFLSAVLSDRKSKTVAARFDTALNNMSHGLCMFDANGLCVVVNERLMQILGVDSAAISLGMSKSTVLRTLGERRLFSGKSARRLRQALTSSNSDSSIVVETRDKTWLELTTRATPDGGSIIVVQDVTERRNAERVIDRMARFDSVTGLPNRRYFEDRLSSTILQSRETHERIAVLFIDLDDFKQVNDSLGHHAGDQLLTIVGERLKSVMRGSDTVARWGGDEFVVLLSPSVGSAHVAAIADRIIKEISRPCDIKGYEVSVGASIGIARLPDDGTASEELLSKADMSLYAAKAEGRNRWRTFETAMDDRVKGRLALENDLRQAVAEDAIHLHYQPIVDVRTRKMVGVEALARWTHPVRGPVPPAEFIPIVEELGLIDRLGTAVLRKACKFAGTLPPNLRMSVNLSPTQFWSGRIVDIVASALRDAGLRPSQLELEITESTLLDSRADTRDALESLRHLGVRIALDDFGTGYSSLSYLLNFPLHRVKLDRSFTMAIGNDERASILIESIAQMCTDLGMSVVIEGIETEQQVAFIIRSGLISEAQGYLFSRPLPEQEILRLATEAALAA